MGDFTLFTYLAPTLEASPKELNVTAARRAVVAARRAALDALTRSKSGELEAEDELSASVAPLS